jgi:hypothetical protein
VRASAHSTLIILFIDSRCSCSCLQPEPVSRPPFCILTSSPETQALYAEAHPPFSSRPATAPNVSRSVQGMEDHPRQPYRDRRPAARGRGSSLAHSRDRTITRPRLFMLWPTLPYVGYGYLSAGETDAGRQPSLEEIQRPDGTLFVRVASLTFDRSVWVNQAKGQALGIVMAPHNYSSCLWCTGSNSRPRVIHSEG